MIIMLILILMKCLMTYKEYDAIPEHDIPYIFSVARDDQILLYFGAEHQTDIAHPQFNILKNKFELFLQNKSNKKIVFVEGGLGKFYEDVSVATATEGEPGFISYLAKENNIQVYSPEPSSDDEIGALLKKFKEEEIVYYYMSRVIAQFNRQNIHKDLYEYIDRITGKELQSSLFTRTYNSHDLSELHSAIFGSQIDLTDHDFFSEISNPLINKSIVNRIAEESGYIRDYFIINKIKGYWKDGFSIFIVYGYTHAVMQEKCILEIARN